MSEFDPDKQTLEQYDGECNCDPRVGFAPCELCHDRKVIGKLREENQRLRELQNAATELLASAQGGDYGEIVCDADDFAELEELAKKESTHVK